MDKRIIEELEANIEKTSENKSSHWKKYLYKNIDYKNPHTMFGFGSFTKKNYKSLFHNILQKKIFGKNLFMTNTYKKYQNLFDEIGRQIDIDTVRHILTFEKLRGKVNPKKICIIGDGKCNGVLGAHLTFPEADIISVNLSETLINDYIILNFFNVDLNNSTKLISSKDENLNNSKLFLVPSNLKEFLLNKNIDLFINIASFHEMNIDEISKYFKVIKNNKSILYCCNREYKKLVGGEELHFDKYPWDNTKKLFWEDCPWHQNFYAFRPPFIRKYDGNIKHCLVDFS